jgi:hypothetical protein
MGEALRKKSTTQRFIADYPDCCFCAGSHAAVTREHMPPKSLFDNSHRPDELVMPACDGCNRGTSTADLTVSLVSRWSWHGEPQARKDHNKLVERLRRQAPEIIAEWTSGDLAERARGRRHLVKQGVSIPPDGQLAFLGVFSARQLNLFAHKAVLGLYFQHFRVPLLDTGRFCAFWRTKEDFPQGIPTSMLSHLPGYATIAQGRWDERKTFEYRHALNIDEGLFACLARFRQGYFVFGFAVRDASQLPSGDADWIKPSSLFCLVSDV